jgi:hypothetical protein
MRNISSDKEHQGLRQTGREASQTWRVSYLICRHY